jgi:MSHA biogenesis protein MshG
LETLAIRLQKIKTQDLQVFSRQMYSLVKSGIPLISAIKRLGETSKNKRFGQVLETVAADLSGGTAFAAALAKHPDVFPILFVNIVKVGEKTGDLDEAFSQLSSYLEMVEQTNRHIKGVLRYPIIVLFAIVGAILVINTIVIPAFMKLFAAFDQQLPLPTRILMATSYFMTHYWYVMLGGFALIVYLVRKYLQTEHGKLRWHRRQLRLPIVGPILNKILLARFARSFALIEKTGLPVTEGLRYVADAMGNVHMQNKLLMMQQAIIHGEGITKAATNTGLFSPIVLQMLSIGEETGRIDELLLDAAEFYEREIQYDLARLNDYLDPILLIVLGIMVLILALGVFLPMWDIAAAR